MAGNNPLDKVHESWSKLTTDRDFIMKSDAEQQQIKDIFRSKVPEGEAYFNQIEGPDRSFFDNMINLAKESIYKAKDASLIATDLISGEMGENTPAIVEKGYQRANAQYTPDEAKRMHQKLQEVSERHNAAKGAIDTWDNALFSAYEIGKEIITNPKSVPYLAAESAGFSLPSVGGAVAGAQAGLALTSAIPSPHVKAASALVGTITGGLFPEGGARYQEEIISALESAGLPVTAENIQVLGNNPEFMANAVPAARGKAAGTVLSDSFLGVGLGKAVTKPIRDAQKKAAMMLGNSADVAAKNKLTLELLGQRSFVDRASTGLKAYTAGIATEPISEAIGQVTAGDNIDLGELYAEAIGAVGMSTITTPVEIYSFGTETPQVANAVDKVKDTVKGAIDSVTHNEEQKEATRINKSTQTHDFQAKVAEAAQAQDISKYTNPESKEYDPVVAITVLKTSNDSKDTAPETKIKNLNDAVKIYHDYYNNSVRLARKMEVIQEKGEAATPAEQRELRKFGDALKTIEETTETLKATVASMHQTKLTSSELKTRLAAVETSTDSAEIDSVVQELFSSSPSDIRSFGSSLESIQNNPHTSKETKQFIQDFGVYRKSKEKLTAAAGKNAETVHDNIFTGVNGEYLGVDTYRNSISQLLQAGKVDEAKKQFELMGKFAATHRTKANTLRNANEAAFNKTPLDPETQASLDDLNKKKVKPWAFKNPRSEKWLANLDLMDQEADAIEEGLKAAASMFGVHKQPVPTVTVTPKTETKTNKKKSPVDYKKYSVKFRDSGQNIKAQDYLDLVDEEIAQYEAILDCVKG